MDAETVFNGKKFEKMFRPTSEFEVKEIITNSSNKLCHLDPCPLGF